MKAVSEFLYVYVSSAFSAVLVSSELGFKALNANSSAGAQKLGSKTKKTRIDLVVPLPQKEEIKALGSRRDPVLEV